MKQSCSNPKSWRLFGFESFKAFLNSFHPSQIESDDDVPQVKDEKTEDIKKNGDEGFKPSGKTSIMTTSTGKTLKRKHDDDVLKNEEVSLVENSAPSKKLAMESLETKSEITITPIPKKRDSKDSEALVA